MLYFNEFISRYYFNQILSTGISVGQPSYTRSPPAKYGKIQDEIDPETVGNLQSKHKLIL